MLALKFHVYVVVDQADNKDNFFRQFKNGPCSTVEYFDQKKTLKISWHPIKIEFCDGNSSQSIDTNPDSYKFMIGSGYRIQLKLQNPLDL